MPSEVLIFLYNHLQKKRFSCPRILRADHGIENAQLHIAFQLRHTDRPAGYKRIIYYGQSNANIACKVNGYVMLLVLYYIIIIILENTCMVVTVTKI